MTLMRAGDVLRDAQDRNVRLCRDLTREATLISLHALSCPRCKRCAKGERDVAARRGARGVNRSVPTRKAVTCG